MPDSELEKAIFEGEWCPDRWAEKALKLLGPNDPRYWDILAFIGDDE